MNEKAIEKGVNHFKFLYKDECRNKEIDLDDVRECIELAFKEQKNGGKKMKGKMFVKLGLFLGGAGLLVTSFFINDGSIKQNVIVGTILWALALPIIIDMLNPKIQTQIETNVAVKEKPARLSRREIKANKRKAKLLKELGSLDGESKNLLDDISAETVDESEVVSEDEVAKEELLDELKKEEGEEVKEVEKEDYVEIPVPEAVPKEVEEPKPKQESKKGVFICPKCKKKFTGDKAEMKMKRHIGMAHWKDL